MNTARRRISIHDYPEHLNPFSENHLTFQDRRKMLADKLRKNGTWSSKISKRLSRSVSWLEKSWLTAEESHKKPTSNSRICDTVHESGYQNCEQTNGLSRTDSYLDIRHHYQDNSPNRTQLATKSDEDEPPATQSCSKPEPKRRKKRPAPLPPITDTKVEPNEKDEAVLKNNEPETDRKPELHITSTNTRTDDQNINANPVGSSNAEAVTKTCQSNSVVAAETDHEVKDDDGTSRISDSSTPSDTVPQSQCSRLERAETSKEQASERAQKQPLDEQTAECSPEEASTIVDHNQNQINAPKSQSEDVPTQSSPPTETNTDQALDENDNISCVQSTPRTTESLSMHCNGKAVMV
ncbi:hypothetical protein V9T40_004963 [Parthenolecanium corni]|uniref:Uncharacterized protein n=1 Tax=Parthenolecanium corni TaxID=536013 RepID=A0AAN9TD97_9HEMI